jgi:hypothetical protein
MMFGCQELVSKKDDAILMKSVANVCKLRIIKIRGEIDAVYLGAQGAGKWPNLKALGTTFHHVLPFSL